MKQLSLKIYGDVQGVFFRGFVREKAVELDITGWVKNNADGTLEVFAQGKEDPLKKLKEYCKEGPLWARVERVVEEWEEITNLQFTIFQIK
jgi:acylphosphatase